MKVLFVSYYFEPHQAVGAKRVSYWAKYLKSINPSVDICDVVTTTVDSKICNFPGVDNVYVVEPDKSAGKLKLLKYDLGAYWYSPLKRFLTTMMEKKQYDYVVYTGNPFVQFLTSSVVSQKGGRAILDFRDPFAKNPRAESQTKFKFLFKSFVNRLLEFLMVLQSYKVIAINEFCKGLVVGSKIFKNKIVVIDNGYDEKIVAEAKGSAVFQEDESTADLKKIIYAGSFFKDRDPSKFFSVVLKMPKFSFEHVGKKSPFLNINSSHRFIEHGLQSYHDTIGFINRSDVAVLFLTGHPFESTTKIFDYIALNKYILIITPRIEQDSAISHLLKGYSKAIWCENDEASIEKGLVEILSKGSDVDSEKCSYKYSREFGLKQLSNLLVR